VRETDEGRAATRHRFRFWAFAAPYLAALDIVLVVLVFKGDVRLS